MFLNILKCAQIALNVHIYHRNVTLVQMDKITTEGGQRDVRVRKQNELV